ncbi:DNA-binding protein [Paenibacillus medicaginis]|uniref:DNA-binding protein n=1 Tax=Paenibacillus medicaginis TaxID=1470560 RepID=A0ABV5C194_9BACL
MQTFILKSLKPDIIVEMLNMAVGFENWSKVLETADILYQCVKCIHEERRERQSKGWSASYNHTEHPLLYYYGYSLEMKGLAFQKLGRVEEARACIGRYAELKWMDTLNEAEEQVVQDFKHKARANRYALEIEAGQAELLEEYVGFLYKHPEECVKGLTTIMEAAVRYGWRIDRILHTFSEQAAGFAIESYSSNNDDMYHYFYHRAIYEQWVGRLVDAVECILQAIRLAHELGMDRYFKRCAVQWESLREAATKEQIERYRALLKRIE